MIGTILFIAALWLLFTGHWVWALIVGFIWLCWIGRNEGPSSSGGKSGGTSRYIPSKATRHQTTHEFGRADGLMVLDPPSAETDDSYGIGDKQLFYLLHHCAATVKGIPGGGLNDSDFGAARVKSGQQPRLVQRPKPRRHHGQHGHRHHSRVRRPSVFDRRQTLRARRSRRDAGRAHALQRIRQGSLGAAHERRQNL